MPTKSNNQTTLTLQQAISKLMANDPNATWDELTTVTDLKICLTEALTGYHSFELTYKFYKKILDSLQ